MKKINFTKLLMVLLVNLVLQAKSQAPLKFFTKFGYSGIDVGYAVKQTLDGHYIIVGSTSSYGFGNTDVLLVKLDNMGVLLWQKSLGGFVNDIGRSVELLPDSGFVVTGYTNSFGNGGYDAYIVRTDKNGTVIWQKTWGGMDWDFAWDSGISADNNIVICGTTESFGSGKKDAFTLKLNTINGAILWQKIMGGSEDDEFKGIAFDNSNNVVVAGYTKSRGDVLGDMWAFYMDPLNGDSIRRLMYGSNKSDWANDVVVMPDNQTILAGGSDGITNGKKDAFRVWFNNTYQFDHYINFGLPNEDEEVYKIIRSNSGFCKSIYIYETREVPSNKTDIKTVAGDQFGSFVAGGKGGSFGFAEDDIAYDIAPTKDKGTIQVGYTESFNSINKDVFVVKRDSVLDFGVTLVGLNETQAAVQKLTVYPNPVTDFLHVTGASLNTYSLKAMLYSTDGRLLESYILDASNQKLNLSNFASGIYFLKVYSGNISKTIKVEKL